MTVYGAGAAAEDLSRALEYHDAIVQYASVNGFRPALIAAIGSRETRWNPAYFLGDIDPVTKVAHGVGPMQIDDRSFPTWTQRYINGKYGPIDGVSMGCQVLAQKWRALFGVSGLLIGHGADVLDYAVKERYAAAAYNSGQGTVARLVIAGLDADSKTTGGNYGADAIERATFFAANGF